MSDHRREYALLVCFSNRSALDEAGGEDTLVDLHGSEYDFILQSSDEEEEEQVKNTTSRITEPGIREAVEPNGVDNDAHESEALNTRENDPRHGIGRDSQMGAGSEQTEVQSSRKREMEGEGMQSLIREYMVSILVK